jgi:hypothetical protein
VLVSNLGLTGFVKHEVNWLNRFHSLPSGKEKKKTVKRQKPQVSGFLPLTGAKASRCSLSLSLSLSFHKKHICLTEYIGGQKSTSSGIPVHASTWVLLLAMQALLVTLTELFFF